MIIDYGRTGDTTLHELVNCVQHVGVRRKRDQPARHVISNQRGL